MLEQRLYGPLGFKTLTHGLIDAQQEVHQIPVYINVVKACITNRTMCWTVQLNGTFIN